MSELSDPRVLFAAERTLLAWSRTAAGLMAFGFLIDRASLIASPADVHAGLALGIGLAFIVLGCVLSLLSVIHYRRALGSLRAAEIPEGYWVDFSVFSSLAIAVLGVLLAVYVVIA